MVLPHGEDALACGVDRQVRVAHIPFGADCSWRRRWILAIETLVDEVGEPDGAVADRVIAAAIFMDARTRVEAARRDIGNRAVHGTAHYHLPAVLVRPSLHPVQVGAIPPRCGQAQLALEEQVDRDGRRPGAEWRGFLQSRLMISAPARITLDTGSV